MNLTNIPEEESCYYFEADVVGHVTGYVYADSEEEARERINNMDIEDRDIKYLKIDDITSLSRDQ
mgnify:CR=1 FL=1